MSAIAQHRRSPHKMNATCDSEKEPWPELDLWLPLHLGPNSRRNTEAFTFFVRSYLLFWPLAVSRTTLRVVLDEEVRGTALHNRTVSLLHAAFVRHPVAAVRPLPNVTFAGKSAFYKNGYDRMQWTMFHADRYTSSAHVGFVDADCVFITYVGRDDVFESGDKPVVNGRIGINKRPPWSLVPQATLAFTGLPEPLRCMSYFPMVVKTAHLREIRDHIARHHRAPFDEVFLNISSRMYYSQFNVMCAYLFHRHRDAYRWYVHDTHPEGCTHCMDSRWRGVRPSPNKGELANRSVFAPYMFLPKGRVAVHARYHGDLPGGDPNPRSNIANDPAKLDALLRRGVCESPPVPRPEPAFHFCTALLANQTHHPEMHHFDYVDWNEIYNGTALRHMYLRRRGRFEGCNHAFPQPGYDRALQPPPPK